MDAPAAVVRRQRSASEPAARRMVGSAGDRRSERRRISAIDDARVRTFLVADEGALPAVLYQIPVVSRATASVDASPDHIIGSPEPGTTFIDGPFDSAYTAALLVPRHRGRAGQGAARRWPPDARRAASRPRACALPTVLAGEQSNTSRDLPIRRRRDADHLQGVPPAAPGPQPRYRAADRSRRCRVVARSARRRVDRRRVARPVDGRRDRDGLAGLRTGVPPRRRGRLARSPARRRARRGLP